MSFATHRRDSSPGVRSSRSGSVLAARDPEERVRRSLAIVALVAAVVVAAGAWWTTSWSTAVLGSASMQPWADPGDLLVHRFVTPDRVALRDVVTVPVDGQGLVTHRVVALDDVGGEVVAVLKGDRSRFPDPEPVVLTDGVQVVVRVLPGVGTALQVGGRLLLGVGALFLLGAVALVVARRATPPPSSPSVLDETVDPRVEALLATCEQLQEDGVADVVLADLVRVRTAVLVGLPPAEGASPVLQLDDGGRFYVLAVADADQAMLDLVPADSGRRRDGSAAIDLWWDAVEHRVPEPVAARLAPWLDA